MFKSSKTIKKSLAALIAIGLLLSACTPAATPVPPKPTAVPPQPTPVPPTVAVPPTAAPAAPTAAPTEAATAPFVSKPSTHVMDDGFVCPEPQTKMPVTSKDLNLFVWTEYVPQDIIDCFQAVYSINVNRDEYSTNEDMYAKLSQGSTNYDLVQPTDYIVSLMIRQGLLQKLDKSKLPVLAYFDLNYLNLGFDPNNEYTIPYEAGTDSIVYNADKVTTPPTSFADLWKPEYAGHLVMLDDSRAIIGATLLTLGYDVNTKDAKQLDQAKAKLAQLAKGVKLFDSDSPKTALIAGDVDLGITWTGEAFLAGNENPAIKYIYPTEGAVIWQDNYAIPKNAPHLDAAYAWLNYSMQPDLFWLMLRDFPYTNPVKGALSYAYGNQLIVKDADGNDVTPDKLYGAYILSPVTNTPIDALRAGHRIDDVGDALPLYDKIWTEIKGQ
jgi:spermidine/putrescine-binding protein